MAKYIFLFDRSCFTEKGAMNITYDHACVLAQQPKANRMVWQYDIDCSTFMNDFNRGGISSKEFILRVI